MVAEPVATALHSPVTEPIAAAIIMTSVDTQPLSPDGSVPSSQRNPSSRDPLDGREEEELRNNARFASKEPLDANDEEELRQARGPRPDPPDDNVPSPTDVARSATTSVLWRDLQDQQNEQSERNDVFDDSSQNSTSPSPLLCYLRQRTHVFATELDRRRSCPLPALERQWTHHLSAASLDPPDLIEEPSTRRPDPPDQMESENMSESPRPENHPESVDTPESRFNEQENQDAYEKSVAIISRPPSSRSLSSNDGESSNSVETREVRRISAEMREEKKIAQVSNQTSENHPPRPLTSRVDDDARFVGARAVRGINHTESEISEEIEEEESEDEEPTPVLEAVAVNENAEQMIIRELNEMRSQMAQMGRILENTPAQNQENPTHVLVRAEPMATQERRNRWKRVSLWIGRRVFGRKGA